MGKAWRIAVRALWRRAFSPVRAIPALVAEPWIVDELAVGPDEIVARGWAFPPSNPVREDPFLVNGERPASIQYPLPRPDVGHAFWRRRQSTDSGFRLLARHDGNPYPGGILRLSRPRAAPSSPEAGRDHWCYPDPARHADLPDEDRRFRVIGNRDETGFLSTGCTDHFRLDHACRALFRRGLAQFGRVLDWGVGCGRIARHLLAADPGVDLVGCDIDRDNVGWCGMHLPGGRFVVSDLRSPLPFPDGHFGLVYGVSVFTHLRAPLEALWLGELRRVLSPGGIALVTVHGATALEFMALAPTQWLALHDRIDAEGLVESSPNSQLEGFVPNPEEYVNVFHSRRHIATTWRSYFDVVRILPGYIFTHDLVVLRRP